MNFFWHTCVLKVVVSVCLATMSSESGGQNPTSTVEQSPPSNTVDEPIPPPLETSSGKTVDDSGPPLDDEVRVVIFLLYPLVNIHSYTHPHTQTHTHLYILHRMMSLLPWKSYRVKWRLLSPSLTNQVMLLRRMPSFLWSIWPSWMIN